MNNFMQAIQAFNNFRNNFSGDPKEAVQKLLQSGKISQTQLNQAQEMAREFQSLFNTHGKL